MALVCLAVALPGHCRQGGLAFIVAFERHNRWRGVQGGGVLSTLLMNGACGNSSRSQRARRFAIRLSVRYRTEGHVEWYKGQVENISESGVLFETEHVLPVNTPIEFKFLLPPTMPDMLSAEVLCRGHIVRTVPVSKERSISAVAATIASYCFRRPSLSSTS